MSTEPADTGLRRINNRSKAAAVLGTLAAFGVGFLAIGEIQFVSVAAIAVGIGVRFGSIWVGTRVVAGVASSDISEEATAGPYHHGAAGIALAVGGVVALVGRFVGGDVTLVAVVATIVAVGGFLLLSRLLPE